MSDVPVSRLWELPSDTHSRSTPTLSTRLSLFPPTSRRVSHVIRRSISRKKLWWQRRSTPGPDHTTWRRSPTRSHNAHGSTSRRSKSSAAWPRLSKPDCPSSVSREPLRAHRRVSTPVARPSSVSTSTDSTTRIRSTSSRSTIPKCARSRSNGSTKSRAIAMRPRSRRLSRLSPSACAPARAICSTSPWRLPDCALRSARFPTHAKK